MERFITTHPHIIVVLIGYFFGCFLTADFVARRQIGKKSSEIGSGNPGTANIGATLGAKSAVIVFFGDALKTIVPCFLCRFFLFSHLPNFHVSVILYAGVGVSLGHMFPFRNRFRGGRGIAVTCTYIILAMPEWGIAANLAGLLAVLITKYLMIGGILIPFVYLIPVFLFQDRVAFLGALIGALLIFFRNADSLKKIATKEEKQANLLNITKKKKL